jgi:hypothetical protein
VNLADRIFRDAAWEKGASKNKTCSIYYSVHTKHKLVAREKQAKNGRAYNRSSARNCRM